MCCFLVLSLSSWYLLLDITFMYACVLSFFYISIYFLACEFSVCVLSVVLQSWRLLQMYRACKTVRQICQFLVACLLRNVDFCCFSGTDECRKVAKDGRFGQNRWKGYHEKVFLVFCSFCDCCDMEIVCVNVLRNNVGLLLT